MKIHASGEDYLEAVLMLQKEKGMVRSVDLARHMGFSKPSISHAVGVPLCQCDEQKPIQKPRHEVRHG